MTRVVGARNQDELLSFALKTTTARVEERCRELRCGSVDSLDGAQRAIANRSLRVLRNAERGTMTITIELPLETGEPLNIGRKTRIVPRAIKRALMARDKSCAFPGCHHKRFVDAHHIQHWSAGGETSLDNPMLPCSPHHKLAHEGGFTIERDYQNHWFFRRPDGRAVPNCGYHAQDMVGQEIASPSKGQIYIRV